MIHTNRFIALSCVVATTMIHTNRFIALSCVVASVFATSCVNEIEEGLTSVNGEGYYISLTGEVNKGGAESRAHWDINNDDKQTPAFAWDASTDEMKSFVWSNNSFVGFEGGQKYSPTTVTPDVENKKQAQLQITTGLSQAYAENDVIWAVFPLEDINIGLDNKVTFTLPDGFTQTALNSTEHLKQYVLMSGTGEVGSDNTASISFDVLPAIYRFKVTNKDESETLTVNEVSISGPFCNQAVLEYGKAPVYSVSNNGTYTIKVATPAEGLEVAAGATAYLYALVFPTNTSSITETIELSFKGKYGDTPVEDYKKTAACNVVYAGKDLVNNTYNDLEVPVSKPDYSDIFSFTDDANLKSLGYGQSYEIQYTADEGATISWSSSAEDIVTVDENGKLKVNTLVGGDATITAEVKKGDISFKTTVDVTVAQGRFDFSFGEGLSPWYLDNSQHSSVASSSDGKTTVNLGQQSSGKYRADLKLVDKEKPYLDISKYPILAIKIALPSFRDNNTYEGAVTLDLVDGDTGKGGAYKNGSNKYSILNESTTPGAVEYIYYDLKSGNFGKDGYYLPDTPFAASTFNIKIADFVDPSPTTYDIYWVKTFASVEELTNYLNSENQTASN